MEYGPAVLIVPIFVLLVLLGFLVAAVVLVIRAIVKRVRSAEPERITNEQPVETKDDPSKGEQP